jgi:porphobilinogen synthase
MFENLSRLRKSSGLRAIFAEARVVPEQLIYPIFVSELVDKPQPIASMPGQCQWPIKALDQVVGMVTEAGVRSLLLFGLPDSKDATASGAIDPDGVVPKAIRALKRMAPELVVMTDVCACEYTDHGHCGILDGVTLDPGPTRDLLAEIAAVNAAAGADVVGPSSMVDGQVGAIRQRLDAAGFLDTAIMAYSAKFASAFYGPFREAADSAPAFGDRSAYQHDPTLIRHSLREMAADVEEGADILMVKPGLPYLDILTRARQEFDLPLVSYWVSGEYSMVKAAAANGWIDEKRIVLESLTAFRRAGADAIITYHAVEAARWLRD